MSSDRNVPFAAAAEHPELVISADSAETLSAAQSPAIAALAGRDSIAATIAAVRAHGFDVIVPTVVLTGTERGDATAPLQAIEIARSALAHQATLLEPVWLTSPALFSALNVRFARTLAARYASWCVCSACHLYVNLCRLPLSRMLGGVPVVAGDRDSHDGRIKPSQTPEVIDGMISVFAHAGVELLEPLRTLTSGQIEALLGVEWAEGDQQFSCEFSGAAEVRAAAARYDSAEQRRFADEYLVGAGSAIADGWLQTAEPDYEAIVAGALDPTTR